MEAALSTLRQVLLFTAVLTPLEIVAPAVPGQRLLRRGLGTDLGWALLAPFSAGVIAVSVLSSLDGLLTPLASGPLLAGLRALPFGLKLALILLAGELGGYAWHRAAHRNPWLWSLHAVHHSPSELDWMSAHRQHPLETAALLVIAGFPAVILGVPASAALGVVLAQRLHTAFVHANLRLPEGPWERLFAGPRFHRWHHCALGPPTNFASLLPVIDRIFGTFRLPPGQPAELGFDGVPEHLPGQLLYPLRAVSLSAPALPAPESQPSQSGGAHVGS